MFDFSLLVGSDPYLPADATTDALVAYLDAADVGGIVTSLAAVYYDYEAGNRETLEISKCDKRLLPGFVVDPRRPDSCRVDFRKAAKAYKALVLFPSVAQGAAQGWPLSHPAVPGIIEKASEEGMPVVIHVARAGDVAALARIALDVEVPVIAIGIGYGAVNEVITGAATADNLLFGISLFAGLDNLETLVSRMGAERFVYDSGEPRLAHGPALRMIQSAALEDDARKLIARGNARHIFGVPA